jgi:hypothetical protein
MELSAEILSYIEGEKFSDTFPVKVEQKEIIQDRMEFIEEIIRGKRVLHIGCLDHVPLVQSRIEKGRWFHALLTQSSSECLGIDINQQGIDLLRTDLGIVNIHYGDVTANQLIPAITKQQWDYAVFGEIIEHIDNPVLFLKEFINNYGDHVNSVIITVPNAFKASNLRMAFKSMEVINSDHRYWFTPYTIWKVVERAGLSVERIQMCKFDTTGNFLRDTVRNFILRRRPLLAEDIVVICHRNTASQKKS